MLENDIVNPESTELPVVENLNSVGLTEEIKTDIESKAEIEKKLMEGVIEEISTEDLNKKNYIKISPTFYIQSIKGEKTNNNEKIELFKILNPKTSFVETRELTDEEKHEINVQHLKNSHIKFYKTKNPVKTIATHTIVSPIGRKKLVKDKAIATNMTINQFGAAYQKKRQHKNRITKASRRANRK